MHQFAWKILGAVFKQTGRLSESITFMDMSQIKSFRRRGS